MSLSGSEQSVLHFYKWEYLGRGYQVYNYPINLEPSFEPFKYYYPPHKNVDDGVVPNLFTRLKNTFFPVGETNHEEFKEQKLIPEPIKYDKKLVLLGLNIPNQASINFFQNIAFIRSLCGSKEFLSFEINASFDSINIQLACSKFDQEYVEIQLRAYFDFIEIEELPFHNFNLDLDRSIAIVDFGLEHEFLFPFSLGESSKHDPLVSFFSQCKSLMENDRLILQILF